MSHYKFEKLVQTDICLAVAEMEIAKREIHLEDAERITGIYDTSKHGTDASRRKRGRISAEFYRRVMNDPSILNEFHLKENL